MKKQWIPWLLGAGFLLCEALMVFFTPIMSASYIRLGDISFYLMIVVLFALTIAFLSGLLYCLRKESDRQAKAEAALAAAELENERRLTLAKQAEDLSSLVEQLKAMPKEEGMDADARRALVNDLLEKQASSLFFSHCPNRLADAILQKKVLRMKEAGIEYDLFAALPAQLDLEPYALMSLMSNLIDNAIRAAASCEEGNRLVDIDLHLEKNYLICSVSNTFTGQPPLKSGFSTRANPEGHGLGMSIVEDLCKEHNGTFARSIENDRFIAQAVLQLDGEPEVKRSWLRRRRKAVA